MSREEGPKRSLKYREPTAGLQSCRWNAASVPVSAPSGPESQHLLHAAAQKCCAAGFPPLEGRLVAQRWGPHAIQYSTYQNNHHDHTRTLVGSCVE